MTELCRLDVSACIPVRTLLSNEIWLQVEDQVPEMVPQLAVDVGVVTDDVIEFWIVTEQPFA